MASFAGGEGNKHRAAADVVAVEGTVTYAGPLPRPVPVLEANTVRHLVEVDAKTKGLKGAVVWIEGVKGPVGRPKPDKKGPVQMDQKDFFFLPHVLAIQAGQEVEFLNSDPPNHGVMATAFEDQNSFNVITPSGGTYKHRFMASRRPIPISCPLHAGMAAWICVFEHPFFAVTNAKGQFRLPPLPPGKYTLVVRHLDGGMRRSQEVTVRPGEPVRLRVEFGAGDLKARPTGPARGHGH